MQNIVLLLLCLVVGMLLRRFGRVPDNAHLTLNGFIINVALPAIILLQIHDIRFDPTLLGAVAMPWLLFLGGIGVFSAAARVLSLSPATTGALMLTGGLGNTSFMGLPMIEAFYGRGGMPTGILIDQLGSYLVLSTLGITIACVYSRGSMTWRSVAMRVGTFPPFIALLLAAALINLNYPLWLHDVFGRLAGTLAPLALVSIGLQVRFGALRGNAAPLAIGLGFKLIAAPAALALLYFGLLGVDGVNARVTLFEAGMGPMIGGAIVATQYGLNVALVTLMVGIGTIAAFATLPAWWAVLSAI